MKIVEMSEVVEDGKDYLGHETFASVEFSSTSVVGLSLCAFVSATGQRATLTFQFNTHWSIFPIV